MVKEKLKALENYQEPKTQGTTLVKWLYEWMEEYKKNQLKITTYESYLMYIRTYIAKNEIADISLDKLSTGDLQKFYNARLKGTERTKKLSRRSVEYLRTIIGSALEQARKNEMIAKNVNEFTVLPRKEDKEIEPLTIEEVEKILRVAKETDLYTLILLEIFIGMRKGDEKMARIISIVNQKGGTGKSACTANLAVGLAQKNMKVLIVDADPQSDVSAGFGYRDCDDSNETLTALMDAVMKDEDIPSDYYIRHQAEGIDIICSNIGLAGTEVQLVNAMSREYVLKQILYGIKDQYDAVIIDCMPSLGMITINALAASDEVLIPVEASYLPIKGLQQLLKTIGKVRKQINPKLQVGGILFTMVDAHTNDARNNMELLRNVYGSQIHIFDNYIPFSVRMKEAVREGQSIFSYDPKGKATEAYRRVTEEVLKDAI